MKTETENQTNSGALKGAAPHEQLVITRVSSRKVCRNPEEWVGIYWINGDPECIFGDFSTSKEAKATARQKLHELGL